MGGGDVKEASLSVAGAGGVSAQNRAIHCLPVTGLSLDARCQGDGQLGMRAQSAEDACVGQGTWQPHHPLPHGPGT